MHFIQLLQREGGQVWMVLCEQLGQEGKGLWVSSATLERWETELFCPGGGMLSYGALPEDPGSQPDEGEA